MPWKAIDSAPKNGRPVELSWAPNGPIEHIALAVWDGHGWRDVGGDYWTDATHWRPYSGARKRYRKRERLNRGG